MKNTMHILYRTLFLFLLVTIQQKPYAQQGPVSFAFTVSMEQPALQRYQVSFHCKGIQQDSIEFKMPVWMPGYYQILNYAATLENFAAATAAGESLPWRKTARNAWKVATRRSAGIVLSYQIKATTSFVANSYLDENRGYIAPTGLFLHPEGYIKHPVTVKINLYEKWNTIATGLDSIKNSRAEFTAPDFDILYDSPILMGNLESFPSFTVKNIPHRFIAYRPDNFDRTAFMNDLKKIITTASDIIGDIPYPHYTFIGIGPGGGGIEHLNSASVAFTGINEQSRVRIYNFLAHEYFHHYNVKRIRPVELGPFDYDNGSRTKMLWLSEGITVYYEYIILKRAGLTDEKELLRTFQSSVKNYETKPGRYFQTPADASYHTWEDGPFGRTGDDVNKTISPYDKGPALGLLLDLKIRHETANKRSLDDLMRLLYNKYYKERNRGFTEDEFRKEAEKMASASLGDFFDYIYTLKPVDYPRYLGYAGLSIDTVQRELPGAWFGAGFRERNDTVWVNSVDWQSPAWEAGIRNRRALLQVNGKKITAAALTDLLRNSHAGDKIKILFTTAAGPKEEEIVLKKKKEASYAIMRMEDTNELQRKILEGWLEGKN